MPSRSILALAAFLLMAGIVLLVTEARTEPVADAIKGSWTKATPEWQARLEQDARRLGALDRTGYEGYVGLEYRPSAKTDDSFAWLPRAAVDWTAMWTGSHASMVPLIGTSRLSKQA